MATPNKRVRFFDGQFLKEIDFRDEQSYHLHARRRLDYFLFEQSGVIQVGTDDLKFFGISGKTFRVRAGMAISRRPADLEGKEIVLAEDSAPIDLDSEGIGAGGTAYVTVHFEEEEAKDPPSEGDVDENTRVREKTVLKVHPSAPPALAPNGEEYVVLGTITYTSMAEGYGPRMQAQLRASLLGLPAVPAPTIASLSGTTSATAGGPAVAMVINGTNLAGATAVTFADPAVTAAITGTAATTVNVTVTVGAAAVPGPKTFQLQAPGGTVSSPVGVTFTVTGAVPAPAITGLSVHTATQGSTVTATISGTNLSGATAVAFSATGVTVTINSGGTPTTLPITIAVASGASTGARTFTVTTPGGTADSAGVVGTDFAVTAAVPPLSLHSLSPNPQASGGTVEVRGINIRVPGLANGAPAIGTSVVLRKGLDAKAALTPVALSNVDISGVTYQRVAVVVPNRAGTPWATTETVTLELSFNAQTGALSFTYDD